MKVQFSKSIPKEEGNYFFFNEINGNIQFLDVKWFTPFVFCSAKVQKSLNPENKSFLAVEEFRFKNVKGFKGQWSDKIEYEVPKISLF